MMKPGLLQWSRCCCPNSLSPLSLSSTSPLFPSSSLPFKRPTSTLISATLNSVEQQQQQQHHHQEEEEKLPARERRKLRNERRESKAGFSWREEVELRLIKKKPKKQYASWTEELNLDLLARLGPQWWVVRVSRVNGQDTADRLARSLINNYPHIDFKVYMPAVQEKRKLKNGSYSVKAKPLFPGCVFLRCVLNKELHDFIRECDGIGGFVGSKVGNTKRQINKPRPVSKDDMEAIFRQAKEEQEKADLAFQDDEQKALLGSEILDDTGTDTKPKRRSKSSPKSASKVKNNKLPKIGSTVRVVSGAFAEFSGILKKLDKKNGKATVGFTLFGKETIADLDIHAIIEATEEHTNSRAPVGV